MTKEAQTGQYELPLGEQVIKIFTETQELRLAGLKTFSEHSTGNSYDRLLDTAVGTLALSQLADLVRGVGMPDFMKKTMRRWAAVEGAYKLHQLAQNEYYQRQNSHIESLISSKKITAEIGMADYRFAISHFDGNNTLYGPTSVTGQLVQADVGTSTLEIIPDDVDHNWIVKVTSSRQPIMQLVNLIVEQPTD